MHAFEYVRTNLRKWEDLKARSDLRGKRSYFENRFSYGVSASLTYMIELDEKAEAVRSEIIASSLSDLLHVQWGISLASNIQHRECPECSGEAASNSWRKSLIAAISAAWSYSIPGRGIAIGMHLLT